MDRSADVAIVGGGVVGLAHAYFALRRGLKVVLFERDQFAVGASVRNFGMIWPIGQEPGTGLDQALRSAGHWKRIAAEAGFWINTNGSLHLAYEKDELDVLIEFLEKYQGSGYQCRLISPYEAASISPAVRREGLKGALWSDTEMTVYSREAIRQIPLWLEEKYGLIIRRGQVVTELSLPTVRTSKESWSVGKAVVCNGADFETLFPEVFEKQEFRKCKLQMMRLVPVKPVNIGPSLCGGLTLRHYAAFSKCASLKKVDERFNQENDKLKKFGIHILVSQNQAGELIVGDSHEYFKTVEPFDREEIDQIILKYFDAFVDLVQGYQVIERWHGVYPKYNHGLHFVSEPSKGVQIVNGLGGAGMTLSWGLAEGIVSAW